MSTKKIERGKFVVEYCGELITMSEARKREKLYIDDANCYMFYFKHNAVQYW